MFSRSMGLLPIFLFAYLAVILGVSAGDPEVTVNRFKNKPRSLFYFDDSPVVLMHDAETATVYRSGDEGKSWAQVDSVNGVMALIDHPTSKATAFIIGKDTKHWVTFNRGDSWQSFETPYPATMQGAPLSFHAEKEDWILFQAYVCKSSSGWGWGKSCWQETYYTQDSFRSAPKLMLAVTSQCTFAKSTKASEAPTDRIFCLVYDTKPSSEHPVQDSRLFRSDDWFQTKEFVDLGIGKRAVGVVGLGVVSKFAIVAVKSKSVDVAKRAANDAMQLFVSTNGADWRQAQFPHSALPSLVENAYTIVESTTHSLAVDVLTEPGAGIGTLFVSSSQGTYFVQALSNTNRNSKGIVDYEPLYGLEGIAIANIVSNKDGVVSGGEQKKLTSRITYDDGSNWGYVRAPATKQDGSSWSCDPKDEASCSLHLHSVSKPHNIGSVFSSTAPGYVMAVGSVGQHLLPYEQCETFLSTDAGINWRMVQEGAHKYEFGDAGGVLVIADDEQPVDHIHYSIDGGEHWVELKLGTTVRAEMLTTVPDSTSQKFLLLGVTPRSDKNEDGHYAMVFLDFAAIQSRQCKDDDLEKWYARGKGRTCLMGHEQWYMRRKLDAQCYVGHKFEDPVGHAKNCECAGMDFECDFNFVRQGGKCVAAGPETVPPGVCKEATDTYMGSSGYRKIPGNTCKGGIDLDKKVERPCSAARPKDGTVTHVVHDFKSKIVRHNYFGNSQTILLLLEDGSVWHSRNEGFSWLQVEPDHKFLAVTMHPYFDDRAYLISTQDRVIFYTVDHGRSWNKMSLPADANNLNIPMLDFHPSRADWLIFIGAEDCKDTMSANCKAIAYYSNDHGRYWHEMERYVRSCQWARDASLKIDERMIFCESYTEKKGSQRSAGHGEIELVAGRDYYKSKKVLFKTIVGYATFAEYLLVAEMHQDKGLLSLEVSLDGSNFAEAQFPPGMRIDNHAYTILESNTHAVFLHMTMSTAQGREWGTLFKSNSNGTYYGMSLEHVNRNAAGYVDFEKMIGLDGIIMTNIVSNADNAEISGTKKLQTRITHNDGGTWKPLNPPAKDSLGQPYSCSSTACSLQLHGYTERRDPKATYSSPSAVGLMLAVGNVGEELAGYTDSDIFLTRDGGFTWEEVHKDAHMWEYGDSGSLLVLVNDEEPTDHVLYTTDEGLTWHTYSFGETMRVDTIQTVPQDTSRKFFLIGKRQADSSKRTLVHLDFSTLTSRKCELSITDPNHDDFELWSPAEHRDDPCLFGRQTQYHRRIRDKDCYIGEKMDTKKIIKPCECKAADFECEFNHFRDASGKCVLVPGAPALSIDTIDEQCKGFEDSWYERTAYRKIPSSSCINGDRIDRGAKHACPGLVGRGGIGAFFWASLAILPFACAGVAGWWYYTKAGRPGAIRLGEHRAFGGGDSSVLNTLASVPYFILGLLSATWAIVERRVPFVNGLFSRGTPYRPLPIDEDAEILGPYEDD